MRQVKQHARRCAPDGRSGDPAFRFEGCRRCADGGPKDRSPAAAFAEDVDDTGEAGAAIFPVGLEAALDAVWIAGGDTGDNLFVLSHGEVEVVDDGTGVQAPVALGLRFNRFVEGEEARPGAALDDGAMKAAIEIEDSGYPGIFGGEDFAELVVEAFEAAYDFKATRLGELGCAAAGQSFDVADDE